MDITALACVLAAGRIALGLAPIVAADPLARALGFPLEHHTPTARLFARLFGVRDIGLGVIVLYALHDPVLLRFTFLFNAAHDVGDALMIAIPLLKRQGITRAAALCLAFAIGGCSMWVLAYFLSR